MSRSGEASSSRLTIEDIDRIEQAADASLQKTLHEFRQLAGIARTSVLSSDERIKLDQCQADVAAERKKWASDLQAVSRERDEAKQQLQETLRDYRELNDRYTRDRESWKAFKTWWEQAVAAKQARTPEKAGASHAGSPSESSVKRKRARLSAQDKDVLKTVGLTVPGGSERVRGQDVPENPTATMPNLQGSDTALVKPRGDGKDKGRTSGEADPVLKAADQGATNPSSQGRRLPLTTISPPQSQGSPAQISQGKSQTLDHSKCNERLQHSQNLPRSSAESATSHRSGQLIKAESDDESDRGVARARLESSRPGSARNFQTPSATRTGDPDRSELVQIRRREMEELRRNPAKYRGHGRYAEDRQNRDNSDVTTAFEIIPELNGGVDYEHVDVVRDQRTRRRMHAFDCPCCKNYWNTVGRITSSTNHTGDDNNNGGMRRVISECGLRAPPATRPDNRQTGKSAVDAIDVEAAAQRQTKSKQPRASDTFEEMRALGRRCRAAVGDPSLTDGDEEEEEREQSRLAAERRQRAGRHRAWGEPAPTPEGYWEIGFPDTPRQRTINDAAERDRMRRLEQIKADRRYRRRGA
ncbi:unnamed protein product [Jaminaea pallidilutea]